MRKIKMEEKVTVVGIGDVVVNVTEVLPIPEPEVSVVVSEEVEKVGENPDCPDIKTTRKRRPSKKALESADLEKEVAKSRKPKKQTGVSNGVKSDEDFDTGHATRQRSKSPRSTGSRSPRSSRSPRPAKEPVEKPVQKKKILIDKEKTVAKKVTSPKPRQKKIKTSDGGNEKDAVVTKKRKRKTDKESSLGSDGATPEKVRKKSKVKDAAEGLNGDAVVDGAQDLGKVEGIPMVPPKKRQRKKPEAEGHILLNSKKSKKTAKSAAEPCGTTDNTDAKVSQEGSEQSQNSNLILTSVQTTDANVEVQNHSEQIALNETQPNTENHSNDTDRNEKEKSSNDPVKPEQTVLLPVSNDQECIDEATKLSADSSEQETVQKEEVGTSVSTSVEPIESKGVGDVNVEQSSSADLGGSDTTQIVTQVEKSPKKKPRKKKEAVEGEPLKEKKKRVKKVKEGAKIEGDGTETSPVKPKKKRVKKTEGENVAGSGEGTEGVPVKEKKKRVRKTDVVKDGGEGTEGVAVKEKKKRVRKKAKTDVDGAVVKGEGDNGVTEGEPVKEKKKRVRKKAKTDVDGAVVKGEGDNGVTEGEPVKEKKKRVRKKAKIDADGGVIAVVRGEGDNGATEGELVKEKKKRVRKTKSKVEGEVEGDGGVVGVVKEKKKRVKKVVNKPSEEKVSKEKENIVRETDIINVNEEVGEGALSKIETVKTANEDGQEGTDGEIPAGVPVTRETENIVRSEDGEITGETVLEQGGESSGGSEVRDINAEIRETEEGCEKKKRKRKSEDADGAKQPVMCEKCGFIAGSRTALRKHDVRCHNEDNEVFVKDNPFKCSVCEYRAKKLSVIKRHVKKHGLEMCRFCQFVGENKILETHVRAEHRKMEKCRKCQRLINNEEEDYGQHVESCQGQHEYKCEHCEKEFKYKSTLKVHQITHDASLPKRFSCDHCDYQSHFKANLQKHIESKHSSDRQRSIPCTVCEKLYYSEANMKKHLKSHTEDQVFQCDKCDKSFKSADGLKGHLATHSEDNPFKCEYSDCERTFKYRRLMKEHMTEFHKEAPKKLECKHEGCDLVFFKKSHLRRHETTHTGDRNYRCTWPDCGKAFRHADNLKVHYRQHTNEKPIQCKLCDFACRQRNSLSWHMKRYHNPAESTLSKTEESEVKNETVTETDINLKLPDDDEASNHSTDSSATIEINTQSDLGSLTDVREAPVWRKDVSEPINPEPIAPPIKEIRRKKNGEPWKSRKKKSDNDNDMEAKPKTVKQRKPRKPRVKKDKTDTEPFQNAVNGAIGVEKTHENLPNLSDVTLSSQEAAEPKLSNEFSEQTFNDTVAVAPVVKQKRKRRTKEEMEAAKAAALLAPPKKRRRRKNGDVEEIPEMPATPAAIYEVQQVNEPNEDLINFSYPYKEKRPPKGKRLLNPDHIKEVANVENRKENVYDFDSDDESREPHHHHIENMDNNFDNTRIQHGGVQQMHHMPVTNYHDVPRQAEMMLNPATGHMVVDMMRDKATLPPRLLNDVVVALSPLDLDKIDRRELLETRENIHISGNRHHDNRLKGGISASDIERDVREIIEKDTAGATSDLPDNPHIFVDNNEEFTDRSDGEIIDRHLLQKYLEDTSMDDFERDLMKEEEKAHASRNQFDNYVSPEKQPMSVQPLKPEGQFDNYVSPDRQPMSVQPMKGDGGFDNYMSPDRQPMSVQPMKGEGQFDNYVSPDRQPMSVQPMKGDGQFDNYVSPDRQPMSVQPMKGDGGFDNYMSPDRQPMSVQPMKGDGGFENYTSPEHQPRSVQPMKPDGQYDKYVSPEHVQVMSNQSVVNHDTMSMPSNASQHGEGQWKSVEHNKNPVSPWTGPPEPEKQVETEQRIFDPYAPEKSSTLGPPLPEKYAARESSAYRIPDYGSMYDTTTRMLASGLSSYPPVSSESGHAASRPSTSFDPKEVSSLGYSQTPTPYLQSSGLYGANMNPPSNSYIDPRVDPYASSQLPSHASALQARENPLNSLAISASKYIESEINKTRVYNQQGWTLQETQSLRLTHSLFPQRNNDWEPSSRPSSTYSYLSDRDMAGYNACSAARPPPLSDRLSAGYLSGQTAESLEKQAFERYDMANYLNSRHAGLPQPPSFNFDRQIAPLSSSAKAFSDSYRSGSSIPDYRGLSHPTTPELYAQNLNLDKYFYARDSMYAPQRVPLPSENPFLSQPSSGAQPNFSSRDYPRGSVYSQPGAYPLMDNGKYSDPGKFAQPISSMQGREFYLPRPGSATGHIQDPYRPPMLYNMMNRYFE